MFYAIFFVLFKYTMETVEYCITQQGVNTEEIFSLHGIFSALDTKKSPQGVFVKH